MAAVRSSATAPGRRVVDGRARTSWSVRVVWNIRLAPLVAGPIVPPNRRRAYRCWPRLFICEAGWASVRWRRARPGRRRPDEEHLMIEHRDREVAPAPAGPAAGRARRAARRRRRLLLADRLHAPGGQGDHQAVPGGGRPDPAGRAARGRRDGELAARAGSATRSRCWPATPRCSSSRPPSRASTSTASTSSAATTTARSSSSG